MEDKIYPVTDDISGVGYAIAREAAAIEGIDKFLPLIPFPFLLILHLLDILKPLRRYNKDHANQ